MDDKLTDTTETCENEVVATTDGLEERRRDEGDEEVAGPVGGGRQSHALSASTDGEDLSPEQPRCRAPCGTEEEQVDTSADKEPMSGTHPSIAHGKGVRVELDTTGGGKCGEEGDGAEEEELAASEFVDEGHGGKRTAGVDEGAGTGVEEGTVDGEASAGEIVREEVENGVDTVKLGEHLAGDADDGPTSVLREELFPGGLSQTFLVLNGLRDLLETPLDFRVRNVSRSMEVSQSLLAIGGEPVPDEPTWGFWKDEGPEEEENGERGLKDVGTAPRDRAGHREEEAVADPGRKDVAQVEAEVLDGDEKAASVTRSNLALEDGDRHG